MPVVRVKGVEPSRGCPHMDLNHARLPFRHTRVREMQMDSIAGGDAKGGPRKSSPAEVL